MHCISLERDSTTPIQISIEGVGTILVGRIDDGCNIVVRDHSGIDEPLRSIIVNDELLIESYTIKLKDSLTSLSADTNVSDSFVKNCLYRELDIITAVDDFLAQNQFDVSTLIPLSTKIEKHADNAKFKVAVGYDTNVFDIGDEQSQILDNIGANFYLTSGGKVLFHESKVEGTNMLLVASSYATNILADQNRQDTQPLFMRNGQLYFKTLQKEIRKYDPTAVINRSFSDEAFMGGADIKSTIETWFSENEFNFSTLKPLNIALPKNDTFNEQALLRSLGGPLISFAHIARDQLISDKVGYHLTAGGKVLSFGSETLHKPFMFTIADDFACTIIQQQEQITSNASPFGVIPNVKHFCV